MAKFFLLNRIRYGQSILRPGTLLDTAQGDNITSIQAAGGVVVPQSDAGSAAAAALVQAFQAQGMLPEFTEAIMTATVASELLTNALTVSGFVRLSLNDFRIVDANNLVGNTVANGGVLASDTAPVLAASSKMPTVTWATGSVPNLGCQVSLPLDWDQTANASLDLFVLSGTTDPATFTVQAVYDGNAAVSYTADDTATKSATLHKISATLLASDMPTTGPNNLSLILTPGTHATNTIVLAGARVNYKRKLLAA